MKYLISDVFNFKSINTFYLLFLHLINLNFILINVFKKIRQI